MLKVLHVNCGTFGHGTYLRELAENAGRLPAGVHLECVTTDSLLTSQPLRRKALALAVKIGAMAGTRTQWLGRWLVEETLSAVVASRLLQANGESGFDVWHLHTQALAFAIPRIRKRPGIVMSFDMVAPLLCSYRSESSTLGFRGYAQREAATLQAADKLIAWSQVAARAAQKFCGAGEVCVVPPPVNRWFFDAGNRKRTLKKKGAEIRILFVGNDWRRKGGEDLVAACDTMGKLHRLTVISGDAPAALQGRPRTTILRDVTLQDDAFRRAFETADIFAMPSREEAFGIAVLEAMAAGLPVVTTRILALEQLIEDAVSGRLIPPGDPAALREALASMCEGGAWMQRAGQAGRSRAIELAHPDRVMTALGRIYQETAGKRKNLVA